MKLVNNQISVYEDYSEIVSNLSPEESLVRSMQMVEDVVEQYDALHSKPKWLLSDITDNSWEIMLDTATVLIDFDIEFESSNGTMERLISKKHLGLLNVFKCWLLIQSSPMHTGYQKLSNKVIAKRLRLTLYLIDFLMLNSRTLSLEKHFLLWDMDLVRSVLKKLLEGEKLTLGIYQTEKLLNQYIQTHISKYSEKQLSSSYSLLENAFDLSKKEIASHSSQHRKELGFLHIENAFQRSKGNNRYGLIRAQYLREKLYVNTLYGHKIQQPKLEKYAVNNEHHSRFYSEFPQRALNIRSDIGVSKRYFNYIRQSFFMLAGVNSLSQWYGLKTSIINKGCFENINLSTLIDELAKPSMRTPTLGAKEVLLQIRNSFEFIYKYEKIILEAVERVLSGAIEELKREPQKEFTNAAFKKYLPKEAVELGIEVIGYNFDEPEKFKKRRKNKDLFFLYGVLQGALQIIVGSTMARRMGELVELDPFDAITPKGIDPKTSPEQQYNLIFDNRKSGITIDGDIFRDQLSRPILNSIAAIIYRWQKFNLSLNEKGLFKSLNDIGLFTSLSYSKLSFKEGNVESFIDNLDAFCDYFETTTYVDDDGATRRIYIRQHQLRRFFAMVFYWAYGYEASETLRYFLGHTDIEHLERYISEETSGEVLRGVQAERIIDGIRNRDISQIGELEVILKNKFGLHSIEYTTYEEIRQDIDDQIIALETTHEHVIPQRYENYDALLYSIENMLTDGTITLKAEYAEISAKSGDDQVIMDLVLKYEQT